MERAYVDAVPQFDGEAQEWWLAAISRCAVSVSATPAFRALGLLTYHRVHAQQLRLLRVSWPCWAVIVNSRH